jgi:hypothetical protein
LPEIKTLYSSTILTNNIFPNIPSDSLYSFIIEITSEKKIGGKFSTFKKIKKKIKKKIYIYSVKLGHVLRYTNIN